jgi:hypothetical protein
MFLQFLSILFFTFVEQVQSIYEFDLNHSPVHSIDLNIPIPSSSENVESVIIPQTTKKSKSKTKEAYRTRTIQDQSFARPKQNPESIMCTSTRVHHIGCPHWISMSRKDKQRIYKRLAYNEEVSYSMK